MGLGGIKWEILTKAAVLEEEVEAEEAFEVEKVDLHEEKAVADTEAIPVAAGSIVTSVAHAKCTKLPVLNVAQHVRYLSSQLKENQYFAATATVKRKECN